MLSANELKGVLGMMPAFATPDAADIKATQTIAVDNLKEGVDKIIKDGVQNIATTGTYGECYSLLFDEFKTLAVATVETVKKRVPLFIGVTSPNPREVIQKMNFVKDLGAAGEVARLKRGLLHHVDHGDHVHGFDVVVIYGLGEQIVFINGLVGWLVNGIFHGHPPGLDLARSPQMKKAPAIGVYGVRAAF